MSARWFVGSVGTDLLGEGTDGVPVVADEDGVEPMVEITDYLADGSPA